MNPTSKYKSILLVLVSITAVSFAGCELFGVTAPEEGPAKLVWKTKTYTTDALDGAFPVTIFDNRIVVMMAQLATDDSKIIGLDANDGKILWQWDDYYIDKEADGIYKTAIYKNKLVFASGGRHYCIDVETGKTVWRNRVNNATSSSIVQLDNKYFYDGHFYDSNPWQRSIFMVDIETGVSSEIYRPSTEVGLKTPAAFRSENGDIMLAIAESRKTDIDKYLYSVSFVLYNVTTSTKVYSVTPIHNLYMSFGFREIIVQNNRIYSEIGKGIICLDLQTGSKLWEKSMNGDFLFSNFIVKDGYLYANCEDGYRYKLDSSTGFVKWQELNTGTCTPIFMMNDVLYYIGGGDGKLYAVDAISGSVIWKIDAPDDKRYGFSSSTPSGCNGRIYCCDHYYAYCFEAAK